MCKNKPLFGIPRLSFIYTCLLIGAFILSVGCKRTESLQFDHSAQDRVLNMIEKCDQVLLSSQNGWQLDLTTDTGAKFRLQMQFLTNKHVKIYGDFIDHPEESTYRYNAEEGAVLSFDSYGIIHTLADPTVRPFEGDHQGNGYKGDYEFIIQKVTNDSIYLQGVKYGKSYVMGRLKEQPSVTASKEIPLFIDRINTGAFFMTIDKDGQAIADFNIDPIGRYVSSTFNNQVPISIFRPTSGDLINREILELNFTSEGFHLTPALMVDNEKIEDFMWDESLNKYVCTTNPTIILNSNSASSVVIPQVQLSSFYYETVSPMMMSNSLSPIVDGLKEEIEDLVAIQFYYHFKVRNGEINSISFFCINNEKKRQWKGFSCLMETVDASKNIFKIVPASTPVNEKRFPDLYKAVSDPNSATYRFLNTFTTLSDPNNYITVYPIGNNKLAFIKVSDSRSFFILNESK